MCAYKSPSPLPIAQGGTDIQSATVYAPLCGNVTSGFQSASTGQSNSGYVLTSTGASSLPTWQANPFSIITGTFTPTLQFGGASVGITYSTQIGNYTQIGNIVYFYIKIVLTSKGSSTGIASVQTLPVANNGNAVFYQAVADNVTFPSPITYFWGLYTNSTQIIFDGGAPNGFYNVQDGMFNNNSSLIVQGFYFT